MLFRVEGNVNVRCSINVEADSAEEAMSIAYDNFGRLDNLHGHTISVRDISHGQTIATDGEVDYFDEAYVIAE